MVEGSAGRTPVVAHSLFPLLPIVAGMSDRALRGKLMTMLVAGQDNFAQPRVVPDSECVYT